MKKNEKKAKVKLTRLQKIFIFGSSGIVFIGAILILILSIASRRPQVAFYNIPEKTQEVIFKQLNERQRVRQEKAFEIIALDSSIPISLQEKALKKADLIIATNDYNTKSFFNTNKNIKPLPAEYVEGMPSATIQTLEVTNNTTKYLPVLYDFYEIDVNYSLFVEKETKNISLWSDLVNFAQSSKGSVPAPFLVIGAEDEKMINSFGMVIEALYGYEELQKIEDTIYSAFKKDLYLNSANNEVLSKTLSELTSGDNAFNNTALTFIKMQNSELLQNNYKAFVNQDFKFFMEEHLCAAAFTSLSEHRTVSHNALKSYKSIYTPGIVENQDRKFLAPVIVAASCNKKFNDYTKYLGETKQTELCTATGLAPVQKSCSVPDVQADDVRYWLAASAGPIMPLSAAVPSDKAKKVLAQYIRDNSSY